MLRERIRIGEWTVEPALDALQRRGETVRIEPKAMELLVILASRPSQVVSREELLSAVWPGVVVGDEALSQAVTKLRKALGDDARSPRYIETISKRGYRLIAGVQPLEGDLPMESPASAGGRSLARRAMTVGILVSSLIAGTYLMLTGRQPTPLPTTEESRTAADINRFPAVPTVTVIPFDSLSDDPAQVYLARGISSDLTTDLSKLAGLRVIGPSRAASQAPDVVRPQQPVAARYWVSGNVQRAGDQLKVNVSLTDTHIGQQLWSERYERALGDLFVVQDEIVTRLVSTLPVKVSEAERRRLARRYTRNLEAYDYFLRGQAALLTRTRDDNERAREMYRKALALDPAFARAYAGLALTHAADYRNQWTGNTAYALIRALELADTAFSIDPEVLEVQWALAYVHAQGQRHDQAISHLNQAIELDPSFADGYALLGSIHTFIGQSAKAIPLVRTAIQLNPEAGYLYFLILGRAYLFSGDAEQALINLREAQARNAANLEIRIILAAALILIGDKEGAKWEADEIRVLDPDFSIGKWLQNYPMTNEDQKRRLMTLVAEAGL